MYPAIDAFTILFRRQLRAIRCQPAPGGPIPHFACFKVAIFGRRALLAALRELCRRRYGLCGAGTVYGHGRTSTSAEHQRLRQYDAFQITDNVLP